MKHFPVVIGAILLVIVASAVAATPPPVSVTITVNGDPTPGATVTAKAAVTINDGSTLQSINWKQTGGITTTLANAATDTVTVTLPNRGTFKQALIAAVAEPPIADANLPANIPPSSGYLAGLQERWGVVGLVPESLALASGLTFDVAVTTTSGTYHTTASITGDLPWTETTGVRNVPINLPVLLHGKTQATYNWTLTPPNGSKAVLNDATAQNPDFTPDITGEYDLAVTDTAANKTVNLAIYAGTWRGIITGQDASGNPTPDSFCMTCHVQGTPHFDEFTPWKQTGHARIFTENVSAAGHYSTSCLSCHTVGYNGTAVNNSGIDEASDFGAFLKSGLLTNGAPGNFAKILSQFPDTAKMTNIQCDNCHGPTTSPGHMGGSFKDASARLTYSSDVCGSCHGEPARHGRYQQWELSRHANYPTAMSEGTNSGCAKCHSAQGFIAWANSGFSTAAINVTWTTDTVEPQTCQTCHEPHNVGMTSGLPNTANVRLMGTTPMLDAGFVAQNVGTAATCMACHNSRRGLRDDAHVPTTASALGQAPHVGPQADIIMGQNLFFAKVGTAGFHGQLQNSCATCHMEKSTAPASLTLATGGGTNHTFFASTTICSSCHTEITADAVQGQVENKMASLKSAIQNAYTATMQAQLRLGNSIDLGGLGTLKYVSDFSAVDFNESHGAQALTVTLKNGQQVTPNLSAINVVRPAGSPIALLTVVDSAVPKAGWNYMMIESDSSKGVHNPAFVNSALDISLFAVNAVVTNTTNPNANIPDTSVGGGVGNGAGAVACSSPYVYWTDIAGHAPGNANSQWRTDVIARNLSGSNASLKFYLHQASAADLTGTGTVAGGGQNAFEDIVGILGGSNNIGALEICSDQPLLVAGRIYNANTGGTVGQNLDGHVANLGYSAGQTISLIGLRELNGVYRTNITVTNGGTIDAQVAVTLYDANGNSLTNYNLTVPAGKVLQDNDPYLNRAGAPNLGWGYATITVLKGNNVLALGSMVDNKTNDPTTIIPKQ